MNVCIDRITSTATAEWKVHSNVYLYNTGKSHGKPCTNIQTLYQKHTHLYLEVNVQCSIQDR